MTHSVKSLADGLQTVEQALTGLPVRVGERRFRTTAYRIKRHTLRGRQMMVSAEDVVAILEEITRCSTSKSASSNRSQAKFRQGTISGARARTPGSLLEKAQKLAIEARPLLHQSSLASPRSEVRRPVLRGHSKRR